MLAGMFGLESSAAPLAVSAVVALGLLHGCSGPGTSEAASITCSVALCVGLAVVAGWYLTAAPVGQAWKEYAEMRHDLLPLQAQSFTFISPMGDSRHYLTDPGNFALINFGVVALVASSWADLSTRL